MPHSDFDFDFPASPSEETFNLLPSFPDTVPTAPLLRVSLRKLLRHDPEEEEKCWEACRNLGFFYLDLRCGLPFQTASHEFRVEQNGEALLGEAERLFEVMERFFDLEDEEKEKYDFAEQGSYFGYKGVGAGIVDKEGTKDKNEFYNTSKNDILHLSKDPTPAPAMLNQYNRLFTSYTRSSHALCTVILSLLSRRLGLTYPTLNSLHRLDRISGDQVRFVRAPPQTPSKQSVALGEHTDFGSVTVLFNKLGGLQVRLPHGMEAIQPTAPGATPTEKALCQDGWAYVRPLPGHCIINLGDALSIFSDGKLRSNIHRVVPPPGPQAEFERFSLVYFCRPEDDVTLKSLVKGRRDSLVEDVQEEEVTAKEWILRRALGRRRDGGWAASKGTEALSMRPKVDVVA